MSLYQSMFSIKPQESQRVRRRQVLFDAEQVTGGAFVKLASNMARRYASDIKHLMKSFQDAPLEQIKPMNIRMFLADHADKPATANRCKRLFSTMWNQTRGWDYTDLPNPCEGIRGHALAKRTVNITDAMYAAVYAQGSAPLRDAMDLLT